LFSFSFLLAMTRVEIRRRHAPAYLHAVHQALQPHLDVALRQHRRIIHMTVLIHLDELDALVLLREHLQHLGFVHLVKRHLSERVEEAALEVRRD
jgi:hypothetical protein